MEEKGHGMATGLQPNLGYQREQVVEAFFSRYFEPGLPPAVLYVTPYNGRTGENPVKPGDAVVAHFAPAVDPASVERGVSVIRASNGKPVSGGWRATRKGTYFTFTP